MSYSFILLLISTIIVCSTGQFGQPTIGLEGQFSFECKQSDPDVILITDKREYEVSAGKTFTYGCKFFVDTRNCPQNQQSNGCEGIEIVWTLPQNLTQLEKRKGITRKTENTVINANIGYTTYESVLSITDVGLIHEGQYSWQFNLRFDMKTIFSETFKLTIIDMLQSGEPCNYDDLCQSRRCQNSLCHGSEPKKFPWIIVAVGLLVGAVIIASIILSIYVYVNRKQEKYLNNRRF